MKFEKASLFSLKKRLWCVAILFSVAALSPVLPLHAAAGVTGSPPSPGFAARPTLSPSTASAAVQTTQASPDTASHDHDARPPPPHAAGCSVFRDHNTGWQPTRCIAAPIRPMAPSVMTPLTVGGGGAGSDEVAQSPGPIIQTSVGEFPSVTGPILFETGDSKCSTPNGADCYSLQLNSQFFGAVSTKYTDNKAGYQSSWVQFVYSNTGVAFIQFWLIGYKSTYGSCPGTGPPGGSSWMTTSLSQGNCYANSAAVSTPTTPATSLAKLSLGAYANYQGSGNDQLTLCGSGGSCFSVSVTDGVLNLSQNWLDSEFNVFGDGGGSQADFTQGTSISILNSMTDQNGNLVNASCVANGYTAETNNLNLIYCNSTSYGIAFIESSFDYSMSAVPLTPSLGLVGYPTILRGETATYQVTLTLLSGPTEQVTLISDPLKEPLGATSSFSPPAVFPTRNGATSIFTIVTSPTGGVGGGNLHFHGSSTSFPCPSVLGCKSALVGLGTYDFSANVSPSDQTVLRGAPASYTVTLTRTPETFSCFQCPFSFPMPSINLATLGLPNDATVNFNPPNLTPTSPGATSTLIVQTAGPSTGSTGTFPFTATGSDGSGGSRSSPAKLSIISVSIAGTTSTIVSTDNSGNTIITLCCDANGNTLAQITYPPGTDFSGGTVTGDFSTTNGITMVEVSGPALPPGKTKSVLISADPSANTICVVDSPSPPATPDCSTTNAPLDTVVFTLGPSGGGLWQCPGSTPDLANFAEAPFTRSFQCSVKILSGLIYYEIDGLHFSLVETMSARLKVGQFFTDGGMNPLQTDANGNPSVTVIVSSNGVVKGTNPGVVLAWVNATNTGTVALDSLKLSETIPVGWAVSPLPGSGAVHVFLELTNGTLVEITEPGTIHVSIGNPQTIIVSIPAFSATSAGTSLTRGMSILVSVKLTYSLKGTAQSITSYPRSYTATVSVTAWAANSFAGNKADGITTDSFIAYAKKP